jgi:predicted ribosome quality control (RQC) complex YloA/Tae2 family protein
LITVEEILLLQVGRHFRLSEELHLVVGRREEENQRLLDLFREGDTLLKLQGIPGPLGLLRGPAEEEELRLAASIVARYSKAKNQEKVKVQYGKNGDDFRGLLCVPPAKDEQSPALRY